MRGNVVLAYQRQHDHQPQRHRPAKQAKPQLTAIQGGRAKGARPKLVAAVRSPLAARSIYPLVVIWSVVVVGAIVLVQVLTTNGVNASYEQTALRAQIRQVNQDVQTKQEQLRREQASLPARAAELGLEPAKGAEVINISRAAAEIAGIATGGAGARDGAIHQSQPEQSQSEQSQPEQSQPAESATTAGQDQPGEPAARSGG